MSNVPLPELAALVTSIGEHVVEAIPDGLGVYVVLDDRDRMADVWIAAPGTSDEQQLEILGSVGDVEDVFTDEVVMTFHLVDTLDRVPAFRPATPAFAHAAA